MHENEKDGEMGNKEIRGYYKSDTQGLYLKMIGKDQHLSTERRFFVEFICNIWMLN